MLFTFLITIVFVAEIIIALAIISYLFKFDKKVCDADNILTALKPSIREISSLVRKISGQAVEFSKEFVSKFEQSRDEIIIKQIAKFILGILFLNRLKKSKLGRTITKGLSLLQIVI